MPKTELKSLAHPEWPYAGTAHEWRGFVRVKPVDLVDLRKQMFKDYEAVYQKQNFGPDLK